MKKSFSTFLTRYAMVLRLLISISLREFSKHGNFPLFCGSSSPWWTANNNGTEIMMHRFSACNVAQFHFLRRHKSPHFDCRHCASSHEALNFSLAAELMARTDETICEVTFKKLVTRSLHWELLHVITHYAIVSQALIDSRFPMMQL